MLTKNAKNFKVFLSKMRNVNFLGFFCAKSQYFYYLCTCNSKEGVMRARNTKQNDINCKNML